VIRRWLGLLAAQAIVRFVVGTLMLLVAVAVTVAAAPVSLVAAGAFTAAWMRGWQPGRLLRAAGWCGPMVAVWLAGSAWSPGGWLSGSGRAHPGWLRAAGAPYFAWADFWHLAAAGAWLRAAATVAPAAIPLGLAAGGLAWSYRIGSLRTGAGGLSPAAAVAFDLRQWRRQARAARARIAAPGSVPLTMRDDLLGVGGVIRSVGHRAGTVATIGYQRMRSHQVVIGTTGTGKTTLLLRLWAGFMATGLRRHAAGLGPPPLLVVLDCKGGSDARRIADRVRRVLRQAGARSTAIWPDEASLSLWSLPPRQLTTTLVDLIEHGTGAAAYYTDVMEALVGLAVEAPCGPPASARDLLARLEPGWLSMAYAASGTAADHAMIRSASRQLNDVALRFRTLFGRLGDGLDAPGGFGDADVWYCILEGTDQVAVAEGQARALVDLLASFAVRGPVKREILLAVDEFSAVSRRLPIWQLYERARSLGLAVQVSAQSWQGLGTDADERLRIAASAEGGIWLLRTPQPEPVTALAGTRKEVETTRRLRRYPVWSHQGTSRITEVPAADPALIRALDTGQTAYIYRGGVTYIQVKRLIAAPAAVSGVPVGTVEPHPGRQAAGLPDPGHCAAEASPAGAGQPAAVASRAGPGQAGEPLPDISQFLDAIFGQERPARSGGTARSSGTARSGEPARSGDPARSSGTARSGDPARSSGTARSGGPARSGDPAPSGEPARPGAS
jgi:hypothetical protein